MIPNQWYAILPSKAVQRNQILGVRRCNLDLALYRNAEGALGCVVDQCSHRGAALSLGKVKGNCVQCPFHGIEFDQTGKCKRIPALGKASTMDLTRFHVKSYSVKEANDIIYLWYGEPGQETETLPFFHDYLDPSHAYAEIEDHWATHYSRAIENQLDVVHLPFVHHNTIGRGNKTLINGPKVLFENNTLTTSANNEVDQGQAPKSASESVIKQTNLNFRFPNVWLNHISSKLMVLAYFAPVDDENTIMYLRFYNKLTPLKWLNQLIAYIGNVSDLIIERQDRRVVITQKPKASSYQSKENLIPGDGPIITYRRIRDELINNPQRDK